MTDIKKQQLEQHLSALAIKSMPSILHKPYKVTEIVIPTMDTLDTLVHNNYNVTQLKTFAKHYHLRVGGTKSELINRLYCFLFCCKFVIKLQKQFRGHIVRRYKQLHGPAAFKRQMCTNECDFATMEPVDEIPFHQFFSYQDADGFVYGFDITSLNNLFVKTYNGEMKNPYNRNKIPVLVLKSIRTLIKLGQLLHIDINLTFEDDSKHVSKEKAIELRTIGLFQQIDALGNYSNPAWFLSLQRNHLIHFARHLIDIWQFRAQLSTTTKRAICPPYGDPFRDLPVQFLLEYDLGRVQQMLLDVIDQFVNRGENNDSKALGAFYVLGALTLVNTDAATSLPWLFESINYF